MMKKEMRCSTVVITGASSGIGKSTALLLDKSGYNVFAGVRSEADANSLRALASTKLTPLILDVTRPDDVLMAVQAVSAQVADAPLIALINNAGFNYNAAFEFTDIEKARSLIETNLFGLSAMSQTFLPLLRQTARDTGRTAKIVNLGSIGSLIGIPWEAYYHASKFAVLGLSESLRNEVYAHGVRVCVVCPGGVKTPFIAKSHAGVQDAINALPAEAHRLYAHGLTTLGEMTKAVNRLSSQPEAVARKIAVLICRQNPRFRTLVGMDAHFMNAMRILPPSLFHRILRLTFGC